MVAECLADGGLKVGDASGDRVRTDSVLRCFSADILRKTGPYVGVSQAVIEESTQSDGRRVRASQN